MLPREYKLDTSNIVLVFIDAVFCLKKTCLHSQLLVIENRRSLKIRS